MIKAILLAAGQSKRLKNENKLIKKFKNKPLITFSVNSLIKSKVNKIIIVLGYECSKIKKVIKKNKKINFIFNKRFKSGMSTSIKTGLDHLSKKCDAFFICLGDMPMVNLNIYNQLIKSINKKEIIVPTYKGQQGNPVLFSATLKKEIMSIEGDVGAKKILLENKNDILNLQIDDDSIIRDFNIKENFSI